MPVLLVDRIKCLGNIEKMALMAKKHGLGFRPHFKTHQSASIGQWYKDFGVSGITVSSFRMAEYFAVAGWKDLLVAFPFSPPDLEYMVRLPADHTVSILVDSEEIFEVLQKIRRRVSFYIDVDTGYGRTGVRSDDPEQAERIIRCSRKNRNLDFAGFYCHAGHSYKAAGADGRREIHRKALSDLAILKQQFSDLHPRVLYGDTPNCSTQENFEGVDTITPGNFVFYDLFQWSVGSCREDEIAVAMACPVVSRYPGERKLLIHGGAVHFSKEELRLEGQVVFGRGVEGCAGTGLLFSGAGWSPMKEPVSLTEISQEHGIIRDCPPGFFDRVRIGDLLYLLPVHSCLTANLMGGYVTTEGQQIGMMPRPG
ncbi:MAG TPA: alanine racemase [Bacteroides sp.]|nr:alanine racemase [Bacteroides sp.]